MQAIGKKIRLQRKLKSMTLKELASRTGLSISFLSEVARGVCQPSIGSLRKIAQALGISLLGLSENGGTEHSDNPVLWITSPVPKTETGDPTSKTPAGCGPATESGSPFPE